MGTSHAWCLVPRGLGSAHSTHLEIQTHIKTDNAEGAAPSNHFAPESNSAKPRLDCDKDSKEMLTIVSCPCCSWLGGVRIGLPHLLDMVSKRDHMCSLLYVENTNSQVCCQSPGYVYI